METLKELVDAIVETEKLANIDLEAWDRRTLSSITSTVMDAKERLVEQKKKYFDRVAEMTVGIFVLGPSDKAFAKIAEEEGGTVTLHADALYARFADMIEPVLPDSREFGIVAYTKITQGLAEIGREIGIKVMDLPKYNNGKVADRAALMAHIRTTIRDAFGDDFNRLFLSREIQKQAYAMRFKGTAFPVVIIGLESSEEAIGLESAVAKFGAKVFTNAEVTKEEVLETFAAVKAKFKTKTK